MCVTIRLTQTGWVRWDWRWWPRWTDRGRPARCRRCGHTPAGGRRRPARGWRRGHGHGHVDVVVLAEEDPLEPVFLDPGQVPDEAEQAGPGRHTGGALLLGGQPRGHPDHRVAHLVRKYNSTSRSDSATSRPALSLTLMPPEIRACPRGRPPANAGHRESGATVAGQGAVTGDHRASQPEPPQPDAEWHPPRHAAAHPGGHQHSPQDVYQ